MGRYLEDFNANAFAGLSPGFFEVDHVEFLRPADVGNFLCLKCCVLYAELDNPAEPLVNVEVVADVMQPELRSRKASLRWNSLEKLACETCLEAIGSVLKETTTKLELKPYLKLSPQVKGERHALGR